MERRHWLRNFSHRCRESERMLKGLHLLNLMSKNARKLNLTSRFHKYKKNYVCCEIRNLKQSVYCLIVPRASVYRRKRFQSAKTNWRDGSGRSSDLSPRQSKSLKSQFAHRVNMSVCAQWEWMTPCSSRNSDLHLTMCRIQSMRLSVCLLHIRVIWTRSNKTNLPLRLRNKYSALSPLKAMMK